MRIKNRIIGNVLAARVIINTMRRASRCPFCAMNWRQKRRRVCSLHELHAELQFEQICKKYPV